jgi:calcineurin-like phosphoesterase family protein
MAHWFTADPHFGHDNIVASCARPFRDAEHMTAVLIERLWERVGEGDDLWILGDFAFGPRAKDEAWLAMLFHQLPGARKHLVTGNHDGPATLALPWDSVSALVELPLGPDDRRSGGARAATRGDAKGATGADGPSSPTSPAIPSLALCHYPMLTWPGARKGGLQLFGHVHAHWPGSRNSVNVGVDLWDFRPVSAQDAAARARTLPVNKHWADVEPRTGAPKSTR